MSQTKAELIDAKGDANFDSGTLYVDATNNRVGIRTTTPSSYATGFNDLVVGNHTGNHGITIASESTATGRILFADGTGASEVDRGEIIYNHSNDSLTISVNRSTAATIDSSGRLLVGTSTAATAGNSQYALLAIRGNTLSSGSGGLISLQRGETSASGNITAGESIGGLVFGDSDGQPYASILCDADGTSGTNDYPGRLVFSTTADGASSSTERMRINSDGDVLFNTTSIPNGTTIYGAAFEYTSNNRVVLKTASSVTTAGTLIAFYNPNGNVGTIATSGSATAYNTSSDYRLKENIAPVTDGITRLQQLKPSRFNFIADPDTTVDGFIAHEAQAVVPECVTGTKDEVDENGDPVYQGIDQSKLVPLLTAALQELVTEVESLKAEVTALKAQ